MAATYNGPADRLERYSGLVAAHPEVDLKGAAMPYTSRNGHMFSFLDPTGTMALRLSADDRQEFIHRYQSAIAEQYGRQMKEFVVVPGELLDSTDELLVWFGRSFDWIGTLRPKPTKR